MQISFTGDPTGNRTRVTAVKGRCLNRLTMGPYNNQIITNMKQDVNIL